MSYSFTYFKNQVRFKLNNNNSSSSNNGYNKNNNDTIEKKSISQNKSYDVKLLSFRFPIGSLGSSLYGRG